MKLNIVLIVFLFTTDAFADFDRTALDERAKELIKSIESQMQDEERMAEAAAVRRAHNVRILQQNDGGTLYEIPQSNFDAEERLKYRTANRDSCLASYTEEQIKMDLNKLCNPDDAFKKCREADEAAQAAEYLASDQRIVIQANSPGATNALENAVSFWNSFVGQAENTQTNYKECEKTLRATLYSPNCFNAYDSFFSKSNTINVIRNTCHPQSIDIAINRIIREITRPDASGLSKAERATKAKESYNNARRKGIKIAQSLFHYYNWLVSTFPDKFAPATAQNDQ